jgi:hypothetical protein
MNAISFYKTPQQALQRVSVSNPFGLVAITRNFLETNIARFEVGSPERLEAFERYSKTMKSPQNTIEFILRNGMYPFCEKKRDETMASAREISLDKQKMGLLLQKTKFCTNWKHASGYDETIHGPCGFAHTLDDYNPPHCVFGLFCEKDQCDKNHGVLSKQEWVSLKSISVPVVKKEMKPEFCRCLWTKKRCQVSECPFMHSLWELLENFQEYKKLSGVELMREITIPCKAFRSTEQNKKEVKADDMEIEEQPIEEEKEAAAAEENDDEDDEDDEEDDLVIVIDQGAIKTFFENFDLETQIKRQHQLEMEYEEYEVESEPEPEYSEYVKTMATLLGMPENQLQKLVENGKQHVIDQWLQRKMDHESD